MMKTFGVWLLLATSSVIALVGCKKEPPEQQPTKPPYQSKGDEGEIKGVMRFDGIPPLRPTIAMNQDPYCASAPGSKLVDDLLVEDGKLQNVFVYLKGDAVDQFAFEVPADSVVLDQLACRYEPRILGMQVGQVLEIYNSDSTTHNVHPLPRLNREWNKVQAAGQEPLKETFKKAEVLVTVRCNQHPWMIARVGVLEHPSFAVSAKDGSFIIKNVPPGKYTLLAYHEKLGEKQVSIDITAKATKTQDFTFSL
jgi:plastocyanin